MKATTQILSLLFEKKKKVHSCDADTVNDILVATLYWYYSSWLSKSKMVSHVLTQHWERARDVLKLKRKDKKLFWNIFMCFMEYKFVLFKIFYLFDLFIMVAYTEAKLSVIFNFLYHPWTRFPIKLGYQSVFGSSVKI